MDCNEVLQAAAQSPLQERGPEYGEVGAPHSAGSGPIWTGALHLVDGTGSAAAPCASIRAGHAPAGPQGEPAREVAAATADLPRGATALRGRAAASFARITPSSASPSQPRGGADHGAISAETGGGRDQLSESALVDCSETLQAAAQGPSQEREPERGEIGAPQLAGSGSTWAGALQLADGTGSAAAPCAPIRAGHAPAGPQGEPAREVAAATADLSRGAPAFRGRATANFARITSSSASPPQPRSRADHGAISTVSSTSRSPRALPILTEREPDPDPQLFEDVYAWRAVSPLGPTDTNAGALHAAAESPSAHDTGHGDPARASVDIDPPPGPSASDLLVWMAGVLPQSW